MILNEEFGREFLTGQRNLAFLRDRKVGIISVRGANALDFLHRLSTNNLLNQKPGGFTSTVFTTEKGRVVDWVRVLTQENRVLLVTSVGREQRLIDWLEKFHITEEVQFDSVTSDFTMSCFAGPDSHSMEPKLFTGRSQILEPSHLRSEDGGFIVDAFTQFNTKFVNVLVSLELRNTIFGLIQNEIEGCEIGNTHFETFLLRRGIPQHPIELSEDYNPLELGLRESISFSKGCYIGQEVIARLDTYDKVQRELIGFVLPATNGKPEPPLEVQLDGVSVGTVTSVSPLPINDRYLAKGMVRKNRLKVGDTVTLSQDKKTFTAAISSLPIAL